MTTTTLAVQADVEAALGRSLTDANEIARANSLLVSASADVETLTGWYFLIGSYSISRLTHGDNQIVLPGDVSAVSAVRDIDQRDGTATVLALTTDYTIRGRVIYLMQYHDLIEIDFATNSAIPDEIVKLVAGCVAATLAAPPVGASSETAGPYSVSYIPNTGKLWLSAADKRILGRYRQPRSAIAVIGL